MPRTITIDNVEVTQIQLVKDSQGTVRVFCEYHLKVGSQLVQLLHQEVTAGRR